MKLFAIRDEMDPAQKNLGFVIYYEKAKKFFVEIPRDSDPWELPLLLSSFAQKGVYSIGSEWSALWVQQRIVPTDRQNLGQILKDNKLKEYDEYKLLMLAQGRCEQDDYYLVPIEAEDLPEEIILRYQNRIDAVIPLAEEKVLVFFCNGRTKKYNAEKAYHRLSAYYKRLNSEVLFRDVRVSVGGLGINWGSEVSITKDEIYEDGEDVPISLDELKSFFGSTVINSAEAAEILNCSRQNIEDLVKRDKLLPLKKSEKSMLFLKDDVLRRLWD